MALSFDATYYLNARPDVFHAFVATAGATGKTWAQFAEEHYNTFGRFEGANPNATFNTDEYLAANPDVAAAGVNPFTHYLHFGAAEGRAPSDSFPSFASFDYATYLAANPDLGAAGIDTPNEAYAHFVIFGQFESRPGAPAVDTGVPGRTEALTVNPDLFDGTPLNDTINGLIDTTTAANSTFTDADVIDGAGGKDTLNVTVVGNAAGTLPAAAVSNVEIFNIRDLNTAGGSVYNFGLVEGETEVWADRATSSVTFQNLGDGATVGVRGNGSVTNGAVSFNYATATGAVNVVLDGGLKGAPSITATAGTATSATITSKGAANTVNNVELSGGTNTITSLTINAEKNFTGVLKVTDYAASAALTIKGGGDVSIGAGFDGATVDATVATGKISLSTTAGVTKSVVTGSGDDTITLVGALAANGTINLGAGNDKLLAGAGAVIGTTNVIDGGEGSDAISASLINAANAAKIKNFELLDLSAATASDLDVELITGSTIESFSLSGVSVGNSKVVNAAAGVGLTVAGDNSGASTEIVVKGSATGAADAFAVTFDGAAVVGVPAAANVKAGTVILDGIENVTVDSTGAANTWNSIELADKNLQTLTISGDKNIDITFVGTNGTNAGVDLGGAVKLIDGSAATGKLNINTASVIADNKAGVGLTVKGGSGNDTITLAQKATVEAGAGDDLIIAHTTGGTFTGGAGNDKFDVSKATATGSTEAQAVLSTVTDFTAGDAIKLLSTATAFTATKIALDASVTNLDLALAAASTATNNITWFQYGANTYVVSNEGTAGIGAGDLVVKITGLVDLSAATFDATTDYLTLA